MRAAHPGVVFVAGVALLCGCGGLPSIGADGSDDEPAARGSRVLEIATRLSGHLPATPATPSAPVGTIALDGAFANLGAAEALDAPVDIAGLTPADRLDPRLPSITLSFSGDMLIHSPIVRGALVNGGGATYDFSPMFAAVAPIVGAADLAICHLETPMAPEGEELSTFPRYGVPPEVVGDIAAAGYDRCSTASNHSLDRGLGGIDATVAAFDRYGIGQSGMARTPDEAVVPVLHVGGIALTHLSYSFGFNGIPFPADQPWRTNEIDPARIIADALDARARGAQVVIVSLHWGAEGASSVTPYQRSVAEAVTASGAVDLIVGHHAHVIQPIEQVNGRWVVFGMGNFLSNMPFEHTWTESSQDGVIIEVTIDQRADGTFAVGQPVALPTWVDKNQGWVIRPVLTELADPSIDNGLRGQLYASLLRTAKVLPGFVPGT